MDNSLLLLAKTAGITSFDSLWNVKHALGTRKIGHTGTLDSFADGLLVVLSGNLTRLVDHITALDKEYRALFSFGSETDTLDPSGTVIRTAPQPSFEAVQNALPQFCGTIHQVPPLYSAIHIDGERASACARRGKSVIVPAREITVFSFELCTALCKNSDGMIFSYNAGDLVSVAVAESVVMQAEFKITCSKGTYIRSLARDLGLACGSASFVTHLRRTRVGAFHLEDAALAEFLPPFGTDSVDVLPDRTLLQERIAIAAQPFTSCMAKCAGLSVLTLRPESVADFYNGKKLCMRFFDPATAELSVAAGKYAVFDPNAQFCGIVIQDNRKFSYGFVVGRPQ